MTRKTPELGVNIPFMSGGLLSSQIQPLKRLGIPAMVYATIPTWEQKTGFGYVFISYRCRAYTAFSELGVSEIPIVGESGAAAKYPQINSTEISGWGLEHDYASRT